MSRARKTDIPGRDYRTNPEEARAQGWPALFAQSMPAADAALPPVVEIGFGRGEFLVHLAGQTPQRAHIGIEVSFKRALKMARRLARMQLHNVRLLNLPAENALPLFAPQSVAAFWVNFPDPWPKKRHHKNRLLQAPLVRQLALRLIPGGMLHAATDHEQYAQQIHEVLSIEALLQNMHAPRPFAREAPGRRRTAYEEMWRAEGRALHFFQYRRR